MGIEKKTITVKSILNIYILNEQWTIILEKHDEVEYCVGFSIPIYEACMQM